MPSTISTTPKAAGISAVGLGSSLGDSESIRTAPMALRIIPTIDGNMVHGDLLVRSGMTVRRPRAMPKLAARVNCREDSHGNGSPCVDIGT